MKVLPQHAYDHEPDEAEIRPYRKFWAAVISRAMLDYVRFHCFPPKRIQTRMHHQALLAWFKSDDIETPGAFGFACHAVCPSDPMYLMERLRVKLASKNWHSFVDSQGKSQIRLERIK